MWNISFHEFVLTGSMCICILIKFDKFTKEYAVFPKKFVLFEKFIIMICQSKLP